MSIEAAVIIDVDGLAIHWHEPPGRSAGHLPDSRDLWSIIWEHRDRIAGIAHSHPGSGVPGPSWEDITTFAAIEAALGRRLRWWITSADHVIEVLWHGPENHNYAGWVVDDNPFLRRWIAELRRRSNFEVNHGHTDRDGPSSDLPRG